MILEGSCLFRHTDVSVQKSDESSSLKFSGACKPTLTSMMSEVEASALTNDSRLP